MYAGHWLACVSSGDAMLLVFFSDKGKLGALELMQRKCHYQYKFSVFGQPWELSSGVFQKLQEFTCHLFVPKSATTDAIINPSLPKGMKSTPASFPHAKIAYSSMSCMQTIKQAFGDDSCNVNHSAGSSKLWLDNWCQREFGHSVDAWIIITKNCLVAYELQMCSVHSCQTDECLCISNGFKCTEICKFQAVSSKRLKGTVCKITSVKIWRKD